MFEPFPKIPRLNRDCVITEKIDGTNAQIIIEHAGLVSAFEDEVLAEDDGLLMLAGSRTKLLTRSADNFGFANWVHDNSLELFKLGPGRHFGEWWGSGIQRGYNLPKGEKRFSLFNTARWGQDRPACCHVVPILYQGPFDTVTVNNIVYDLSLLGSQASPGFMNPEGVIVFHTALNGMFKVTCKDDEKPKGSKE